MSKILLKRCVLILATALVACSGTHSNDPTEIEQAAFSELRSAVDETLSASEQEDEILGLIDQFEAEFVTLRRSLQERRIKFRRLNADYDISEAELRDAVAQIEDRLHQDRSRFIRARNVLIANTTPQQWAAIRKIETRSLDTLTQSLFVL